VAYPEGTAPAADGASGAGRRDGPRPEAVELNQLATAFKRVIEGARLAAGPVPQGGGAAASPAAAPAGAGTSPGTSAAPSAVPDAVVEAALRAELDANQTPPTTTRATLPGED
jgi:hypothetical protein